MLLPLAVAKSSLAACKTSFFGLPAWYEYLKFDNNCNITAFHVPQDLLLVALAIIDLLLRVAGFAAVIFVIMGGIQYATSQGNPDASAKAQSTIINALIGLVLAVIAITFVSFLGHKLG